jgi:hypothetical protein
MAGAHGEEQARRTPAIAEGDVVVAGGGTAGIGGADLEQAAPWSSSVRPCRWCRKARAGNGWCWTTTSSRRPSGSWPRHPDLDANNPLGLETVPKPDSRQAMSAKGGQR